MAAMFALFVSVIMVISLAPRAVTSDGGTTPEIQDVFEGRCLDYQFTKYRDVLPRVEKDCDGLWEDFSNAFVYTDPCTLTQARYQPFVESTRQNIPENKTLFWSGLYDLAHRYGENGRRYVTLEDTLTGYLANSLIWCGQEEEPGIDFESCPEFNACPIEAGESFWGAASKNFASVAKGTAYLIVNGSHPTKAAYRTTSFFGKFELHNINVNQVHTLHVIVAHGLGEPHRETCNNGSLVALREAVEARGMTFECEDNPPTLQYLICSDNPNHPECQPQCELPVGRGEGQRGRGRGNRGQGTRGQRNRGEGRRGEGRREEGRREEGRRGGGRGGRGGQGRRNEGGSSDEA